MNPKLTFSLLQADIKWEDKPANQKHLADLIAGNLKTKEIVLLPEMFTTGFSMKPAPLAELMEGSTTSWMRKVAAGNKIILGGSAIISEGENYYNRFLWTQPDGVVHHYDKRHLFSFAGENEAYTPGQNRVIMSVKGWKICLQVCYDLRFPVWSRNRDAAYDVLAYVANWPEKRHTAWRALLIARAIENQCYVVAVNRCGYDGNGHDYAGGSLVIDPLGQILYEAGRNEVMHTITLTKDVLETVRTQFPFLRDADRFILS